MRDFESQGLWTFPDGIFKFFVEKLVEDNGGNGWGSRQLRMLTLFSLIWSQIQFLVITDYSLGKKYVESMLWPTRNGSCCNRYGSRTTQHMHNQTTSVQLSHSSLRCTQVSWDVGSLTY